MDSFVIKNEPVEYDDADKNSLIANKISQQKSYIEKQYEIDLVYLNNLNNDLLNFDENTKDEDMELFNEMLELKNNKKESQNLAYSLSKRDETTTNMNEFFTQENKNIEAYKSKLEKQQQNEQMAIEKKRIISALIESTKEKNNAKIVNKSRCELLNLNDEQQILKTLNKIIANESEIKFESDLKDLNALKRLKRKLMLRNLKRNMNLPIFDIDSKANELMDSERLAERRNKIKFEFQSATTTEMSNFEDDDIIFEEEILKTTISKNNTDCEIIAVKNILDRFEDRYFKFNNNNNLPYKNLNDNIEKYNLNLQPPIGLVESRYDDVKCVISPLTNKVLKPYIRRDYESIPIKLDLIKKINSNENANFKSNPIDYVHLRPEHVLTINTMLRQNFWNGIEISECLEYTDYTIVALYGKLIIGFAFIVPNEAQNQAYLSFIFVHPDWRNLKNSSDVSIAQYMMFYLIKLCQNSDISLHVSVNSPSVLFYQKFGFKIVEYIKNFYDKYYSSETSNLSKDAFLMCLPKV